MIDAGAENLAQNAKEFAEDSETIGRTSGYNCRAGGGNEMCNLPWALHNYYMQYRYSMDDAMLRDRLFPRLKRAINYYFHFLEGRPGRQAAHDQGPFAGVSEPADAEPRLQHRPGPDPLGLPDAARHRASD